MTGQLLRVTTTPYQSVRFSQSARLVSSDSVDLERRKAIARMRAFQSQHSPRSGTVDAGYDFVHQINRTFSIQSSRQSAALSPKSSSTTVNSSSLETPDVATSAAGSEAVNSSDTVQTVSTETMSPAASTQAAVSAENNSAYTMERGAFEFRVSNGELAFLPSLDMTVMTQRPEVHFEYLGGHNYVPPEKFDDNGIMNLLA